jgi:hypothetical protein
LSLLGSGKIGENLLNRIPFKRGEKERRMTDTPISRISPCLKFYVSLQSGKNQGAMNSQSCDRFDLDLQNVEIFKP